MKTQKNIFIAFILNLSFSLIELIGGFMTNSVSILSGSIHDFADALSIGISYFLEKKSKKHPNYKYTYGYKRYSILSAFIMTVILLTGSLLVIYNAIARIFNPTVISYNGMIVIAILGIIFNTLAFSKTKGGHSLNQEAVNLHVLQDVLSWIVVLIGSLLLVITKLNFIDSVMSLIISIYIIIHALKHLKIVLDLFLEKTPADINIKNIKKELLNHENIVNIKHIRIWSIDGYDNYATLHVTINNDEVEKMEDYIKEYLKDKNISHSTIEIERKKHGKSIFYKRNK